MLGSHTPLTVVVVSVDPAADTPATARAFMRESRVVGPWHWLFGSRARLVPVWNEFGIAVQPAHGDINHATAVYLVDQLGWMRVADGVPFIPSQLAESVRALEK
jgi:cytochrome oxidase Cu insertion factor (SCO1/SenC/PrrC family)